MEAIVGRKRTLLQNAARPAPMAMYRASHVISKPKPKPKIRIIHIFAPEIIKTDVANFRELVQRLTGKPTATEKKKKKKNPGDVPARASSEELASVAAFEHKPGTGGVVVGEREVERRVKKEEEEEYDEEEEEDVVGMWNGADDGGYFRGFADFEGFIEELGEFPLLPAHQIMHGFEETQFA